MEKIIDKVKKYIKKYKDIKNSKFKWIIEKFMNLTNTKKYKRFN